MTQIHIHVEGRDAVALLFRLVELESEAFADRQAAKQLAVAVKARTAAVKQALADAEPIVSPNP